MKTFRVSVYLLIALFLKNSVVELMDTQDRVNFANHPTGASSRHIQHPALLATEGFTASETRAAPSILPPQDTKRRRSLTETSEPLPKSRPPVFHIPLPALRSVVRSSDPSAPCSFCSPDTFHQLPPTCKTVCGGGGSKPVVQNSVSASFTSQLPFCLYCVVPNVEPSCQRLCESRNIGVGSRRDSLGIISGPQGLVVGPGGIRVGSEGVELKPKGYIIQYGANDVPDDLGLGLGDIVVGP